MACPTIRPLLHSSKPICFFLICWTAVSPFHRQAMAQEWTRFRGPNGTGVSDATIPIAWTEKDFKWRIELPGQGHSSPVLWGDKLFVTSADHATAKQIVLCLRANDGSEIWKREFDSAPRMHHEFNSYASSTPAVDERNVYVTWSNPQCNILLALDHKGNEIWRRDFGPYETEHGGGTSPIVYQDLVVIANDQMGKSSLIAVDRMTGKTRWEIPRESAITSYSTPCVFQPASGAPQLIFISQRHGISGVDPKTGKSLWQSPGLFDKRSVASPVIAGDLLIGSCGSGGGGNYVVAIRPGSEEPKVVYKITKSAPYVPTSVYYKGLVFLVSDGGIATCIDAATGDVKWIERLNATFFGSPVCANGAIYCPSRDGEVIVFRVSDKFELLARNPLGESSHSSPAVANNCMYLRTVSHLICISGK